MTTVAITGATGFIGRYLIAALLREGVTVRALTRRPDSARAAATGLHWVEGTVDCPAAWGKLLVPGCVVINLAYSGETAADTACAEARLMVDACAEVRVRRLVHCSTVSVYGKGSTTLLDESSLCQPLNEYGRVKLAIEHTILSSVAGRFETVLVRPSAVFGVDGEALVKLGGDLVSQPQWLNYLRSCLFGVRHTHLVPVETVVAALWHCSRSPLIENGAVVVVSDDDDPLNNFRDVERLLMEGLGLPPYPLPRLPVPRQFLELLLRLRGRANVDTRTRYLGDRLRHSGFVKPVALVTALQQFSRAHRDRAVTMPAR
jgi:nucleoside-diphosphate-sugar epimerase